ncbi:protein translocase subunit SecD [Nocardioides mesophilus]|uniref:Protein translocase subunit SecD n=1 Tax=Nocardioides mesophilus TaxID=433659 RepID=A0A7G9RA91_9ACTN|nr:protein translocase subunit SecD [Nocardioides mesophilus]QNN52516.1 protein translocase subunit SecD [Nocardioides mesophilus]
MAKKASRPGRRLIVFALLIAALYGGVAIGGVWKPKLGLDLQGGTRITLEASTATGDAITPEKLAEARDIIDQRVNGQGVAEAEVAVQGSRNIVVEIPGKTRKDLVDSVKQTAQLRFRLVAAMAPGRPSQQPSASPSPSASGASGSPSAKASGTGEKATAPSTAPSASPKGRAISGGLLAADQKKKNKGATATPAPSAAPSALPSAAPSANAPSQKGAPVDQPLQWMDNPGEEWLKKFAAFTCPEPGKPVPPVVDRKDQPLVTCDSAGMKYLLSASVIEGTQLTRAEAGIPQNEFTWVVDLSFNSEGRTTFADVTRQIANATSPLTGQQKQFAIVLDGTVISAPVVDQPIPNGQAVIRGDFSQTEAQTLANSLKYGALPLTFTVPVVSEEGPTLAADQLSAGLWAGAIGLLLVIIYCLFYYRGLGLVVVASLAVAGVITYGVVLAMSQAVNFTLTLPGIAGLIVGVGITADSFIVYFERIRDEMRDGKSMRVAVESGWVRARNTCLAADTVSLLAAVVLYIFAIGVVKGFAFALGISTVIDLAVFFMFTKPMVTWLARFPFFNTGHKMSGLSPEAIGIDRISGGRRPSVAGGKA